MYRHFETRVGQCAHHRGAHRKASLRVITVLLVVAMLFGAFPFSGVAYAAGTVKLTASVTDGLAPGTPYTQTFTITVTGLSTGFVIQLNYMDEPYLITSTVTAAANENKTFTVNGTYEQYQWYVNGVEQSGTSSSYTFSRPAGTYEVAVVVTNAAGRKYSGSCRVRVQ